MAACGVTSGGALPAAVQLLLEVSMVCCAHVSRCLVLRAWLRPWDCRLAQQPVLLLSHRLDVVSKLQEGVHVFPALQQLHFRLRSADGGLLLQTSCIIKVALLRVHEALLDHTQCSSSWTLTSACPGATAIS